MGPDKYSKRSLPLKKIIKGGEVMTVLKETEFKPDWKLTPTQDMAVRLSIALCKHIPAWPGATDEELKAVAIEILKSK